MSRVRARIFAVRRRLSLLRILPGPKAIDATAQAGGTTRTANSVATIQSQISASVAGDTVEIAAGSYAAVSTTKSIGSGFIRIIPASGATVSIAGVTMTGAQGLDWRGINTTNEVYYDAASRIRWRGGTSTPGSLITGHNFRASCSDIIVEDATITNADCSFFFYADRDSLASTNITVQRCRSNNVSQDHVFIGRCTFLTIQYNEFFGNTEDVEHQDGVQIVGGKDITIRGNHIWCTRAFRDAAVDRNDHGIMINYDPVETAPAGPGRVPERITIENNLIHDQTSNGISIAGCLGVTMRNNTVYDNGSGGTAAALSVAPDSGNTINGMIVVNNILSSWSQSGATMTTESHNFVANATGPAGTSRLTGSPGFVDSANQNYDLTSGSQNTVSGTATNAATTDHYQLGRPGTPSRGAIEYAPVAPDTTAPTVPTGVSATANSSSQITITWSAATDSVGVTGYRVKRGGVTVVDNLNALTFVDTGLTASTPYSYTVAARDAAGNYSAESTAAPATTSAAGPAVRSTSNLTWSATARATSDVPVPAGAAINDVAVVHFYTEDSTPTVTAPAGFAELTFSTTPVTSAGGVQRQRVFWKRLTAADTGNYSFTHTSAITEAVATMISGCATTGTPVTALASAVINSSSATNPTISGTTTGNNRLLLWCDSHYTSGADVQEPATFTTVRDGRDMHVASASQSVAGATGTLTGTITTGTTNNVTTLVELAAVDITPAVVGTPTSNYVFGTNISCTVPAGTTTGDDLFAYVHTYYNTPVTAAPAGWTLLGSLNQTSGTMGGWWYLYKKTAKVAGGDPTSYSWTAASQNHWVGMVAVRGANATAGSVVNAGGANANFSTVVAAHSLTLSAITPTVANSLILAFYSARSNDTTPRAYTQPTGMTEILDRSDNFAGIGMASLTGVASGVSTGTKIANRATGGTAPEWGGVLIAIAP